MAGDWIKMRKSLPTDGRVVRMMSALNADRFRTIGGLMSAWCLFDEQTEDGNLVGYTSETFDEVVGFPGLARAMEMVGWVCISPDGMQATNFQEHNGATARRRAQESVRKVSARNADKRPHPMQTKSALEIEKRREDILDNNKKKNAPLVVLPFDSAAFVTAWADWVTHRTQKRAKLTPLSISKQLAMLKGIGEVAAIKAIEHSIQKGWTGLFQPDSRDAPRGKDSFAAPLPTDPDDIP